jgi:two-component system, LuxR family, sensor kinase FixL
MKDKLDIVKDISILYELSLAIGRSLDLEKNCKIFLERLMSKKSLAYSAVWLDISKLIEAEKRQTKTPQCKLIYGTPKFRMGETLCHNHFIYERLSAGGMFRIDETDADFGQVVQEKNINGGTYVIFKLGELGFLKLYSTDAAAFSKIEMYQLRNVLEKFTISLQACISHEKLRVETDNRRMTQEKLAESEEKYSTVIRNLSEGLIVTNLRDEITFVNPSMCRLTGYSEAELLGRKAYKMFLPQSEWADIEQKLKERQAGTSSSYEKLHVRKDGTFWWGSINASPLVDGNGNIIGTLGAVTDVSERKLAEAKREELIMALAEANKDLDDFAYIVSHDLKAPLRGIGSLADWLYMDYSDAMDEDGKEHLALLRGRVRRLHHFIDALLSYARIGRTQLRREFFDLNELVVQIVDLLGLPENCKVNFLTPLPVIEAEKVRIGQVFQNLITNGFRYNDKPEKIINISYREHNDNYVFEVQDNGNGIEQRYFDKIFQIFQTLQTRDDYESTGIGLTIVKKVIEVHKGTIKVESTINVGTTFIFTLPKN